MGNYKITPLIGGLLIYNSRYIIIIKSMQYGIMGLSISLKFFNNGIGPCVLITIGNNKWFSNDLGYTTS